MEQMINGQGEGTDPNNNLYPKGGLGEKNTKMMHAQIWSAFGTQETCLPDGIILRILGSFNDNVDQYRLISM